MSSLTTLRDSLRAVENIKQITASMEMVASARFRKAQEQARHAAFYQRQMQEMLQIINSISLDFLHPLFEKREVKKIGLIIVTSDKGLCGGYNAAILSTAERFLREKIREDVELSLIGRKAIQYYLQKKRKMAHQWIGWNKKLSPELIKEMMDRFILSFISRKTDAIFVAYTKFYNLMRREIVIEQLLPIAPVVNNEKQGLNFLVEPLPEQMYDVLLPTYCRAKLYTMLSDAYAAELAARIFSMKSAVKNAEEMIESLTLARNKLRQATITREMLEMTAFNSDAV